jgi:hypothetical protein
MSKEVSRDSVASHCSSCREQFEAWVSDDPYGKPIDRIPDDPEKFAFPGVYRDINTDLAWQAWQVAWELGDKCRDGCKIKRAVKEFNENTTADF